MKTLRYVNLDPTGNLTCLVLDPPEPADEPAVTRYLMGECEQVAYLEPASDPSARTRVRLMGGEFCGNASMAAACFLAAGDGLQPGEEKTVPLEVSGAEGVLNCTAKNNGRSWKGTVPMPRILGTEEIQSGDLTLTAVRMEGIRHFILADQTLPDAAAKILLKALADTVPEPAAGLLQWNRSTGIMRPLVLVKGSDTLVWETGCGSGSAAVGVFEALTRKERERKTEVRQMGGTITASARLREDGGADVTITGKVRLSGEKRLEIDEGAVRNV